ncbi:indolepyruvate oxidoreductase subunit IorA [Desulfolithobacter dissulfuricans]|uniref:Indolepyruvate oxidoreductase subunit IorA n=1 Tax=Desulfolithobacter dissulfuricans TaxID=2795293 RepID=A0A915TZ77_9BACT|nr:indolepyruvate ferredoxin oxidoreductase subunit alpha [Desulfolithobacter dissulfuricans]BCO07950.1 indolepyruvate oxidoreductase subunit IorA [Desulfolithobacter dissulfuricans]
MGFDRDKLWLSGNEAIALGAWEAGVQVASGYPGTPSTEVMGNLVKYEGVYGEWAPNEKVGLEVAIGASFAGVRSLATMKHVGLNVAADPLFTASYTGGRGGLVILNADDPQMHSSQNEQDNRNYAFAAKLPMLEPSDPAEAKAMMLSAYEFSEELDCPVLFRITTRIAHVKGVVPRGERVAPATPSIERMPAKFVMLPGNARVRRGVVEERMARARELAETLPENRVEDGDRSRGFICAGTSYNYVKEAFPGAAVLKLGMVWPLPEKMIREFAASVDELIVVEELDPFLENHIKAMGIACRGKDLIPAQGELNSFIVRKSIEPESVGELFAPLELPMRPPNMCAGCPHRGIFYGLSKMKDVFVSGDIGCYTLGFLPPLSAMDSCVCMGASVTIAHGMAKALGKAGEGKLVAVLGDSTFMHSGITGLINTIYNESYASVIILDNRITAMTGHQQNPASGRNIKGEPANAIDLEKLCEAVGVRRVVVVNPHDINATRKVLKEEIESTEPSVIISRAPCVLLPEERARKKPVYYTNLDNCTGCQACVGLGCPAISWHPLTPEEARARGYREKQKGYAEINEVQCNGCGQCASLCKFEAITCREEN